MLWLLLFVFMIGASALLFSTSPYYAVFGVLLQALMYSVVFCVYGFPFFALLLILVYIGGLLIIFLFCSVLSAERYPVSGFFDILLFSGFCWLLVSPLVTSWSLGGINSWYALALEVSFGALYSELGGVTCFMAFVLLIGLMAVLVLNFEHTRAALRCLY